jgi:hypothetical protein
MKSGWTALYSPRETGESALRPLRRRAGLVLFAVRGGFGIGLSAAAYGQVPQTLNGPPVQVQPYVPEPGVPLFTINPGTVNSFLDADSVGVGNGTAAGNGSGGYGTGPDGAAADDATGGDYSSGGSGIGNSTALGTMLGTSWGNTAVGNAQALGVNPSALAATCVLESGCQNVGGSGTISGVFQMSNMY